MYTMKFLDGSRVDQNYLDRVSCLVSSASAAAESHDLDELERYAQSVRRVVIQCVDRASGKVGTFLDKADFVATSPVFASFADLANWIKSNGMRFVPGMDCRWVEPVTDQDRVMKEHSDVAA